MALLVICPSSLQKRLFGTAEELGAGGLGPFSSLFCGLASKAASPDRTATVHPTGHTSQRHNELPAAVMTESHELDDLKQHTFTLSLFWRPEVRDEGASRLVLSGSCEGRCWCCQQPWCPGLVTSVPPVSASVVTVVSPVCMQISLFL
uniref:Polypyrimidine tract binding protein 1 n=1 Tax=Myotis myotis TaxID=51298 RepID=A0A7J7XJG4_MYOMY|nr:polypyrimidine tract binding protein 1 [Myotis myotis]